MAIVKIIVFITRTIALRCKYSETYPDFFFN